MTDLTAPAPARTGPMPFTMLIDEAMRRVRHHFRTIYPAVAIPLVLITVATAVLQALWMQRLMAEIGAEEPPLWSFETIVMGLLQIVILVIGTTALQKAAVDVVAGRPIDMKGAWRFAVRPAVLATLLLQGLLILVSLLFCLFPVFYVAPLLSLVAPIMAEESRFGPAALSRSAELTRYNPRKLVSESPIVKALVLFLVAGVISYVVAILVSLPVQIPMLIDIFKQAASGKEPGMEFMTKYFWIMIPAQVLQTLANVAIYMYSAFGFALLYFDTRGRKEGSDLAAEIDSVFGPGAPTGGSAF